MDRLQSVDVALFRFINLTLSNPVFDRLMPFFSGNSFFVPLLIVLAAVLVWREGVRGRICLVMVVLVICLGDPLVLNTIKHTVGRLRPFNEIPDAITRVGRGGSFSMPSSHSGNWWSAATVLFIYYRRRAWFMFPLAAVVGFSRVYNGVHYPSDVLVGAILGVGYATALAWSLDRLWRWAGFGYVLVWLLLLLRLAYLAAGKIELSGDEAYQWLWSKHLALSYYSKPPLIACVQFLGTSIWGDTEFGVRFFSPVITASLSLILLRFFAREASARVGVLLILAATATPLLAVGATLMTIDPLSVLFWTATMVSGWQAVKLDSTRHWLWSGLWMGLGFLSKYTALLQWLCWMILLTLWKPARGQLRRPGPYLALLVNALCALPVLIWNARNGWITVTHLEERGGLDTQWHPSLRYFWDFLGAEAALLNPFFFAAAIWAAIAFWRRQRQNPLLIYLFSMGAPLFLFYLLYALRSRVLPNWIVPSIAPLFCLAAIYWDARWRAGVRAVKAWFIAGVAVGLTAVIIGHDTDLTGKIFGRRLPPKFDPLTRVRAYRELARVVGKARTKLLAEGKPVFVMGNHYGITSLITFYLPEAKAGVPNLPLVYSSRKSLRA